MSNDDPRSALDEAQRCLSELRRLMDAAIDEAMRIAAIDMVESIEAAKAATVRGTEALAKLREMLLEPPD